MAALALSLAGLYGWLAGWLGPVPWLLTVIPPPYSWARTASTLRAGAIGDDGNDRGGESGKEQSASGAPSLERDGEEMEDEEPNPILEILRSPLPCTLLVRRCALLAINYSSILSERATADSCRCSRGGQ